MTEAEVKKLFFIINNTYPNLVTDPLKEKIWADLLSDFPFEVAQINLRKHIQTNKFLPTIADLRVPLEPPREQIQLFHEHLQESTDKHMDNLGKWRVLAIHPPAHVKERLRELAE